MTSIGSYRLTALVLGGLLVLLNVLGAGPWRTSAWGVHLYGYLPVAAGAVALLFVIVAAVELLTNRTMWPGRLPAWPRGRAVLPILAVVLMGVFWFLRVQHDLLGDALPLTHDLPRGVDTHPRQPLAMWFQQQIYGLFGPWFRAPGRTEAEVAASAVALGSVLCGGGFLVVLWRLGGWLFPDGDRARAWFGALVMTQGSSLLFFGYLENYTLYLLGVCLFLGAGVGYLRGRLPLTAVGATVALCLGLHLSSFVLWPGFLFLVGAGLAGQRPRVATMRDFAAALAMLAAMAFALRGLDPDFDLGRALRNLIALGRGSQAGDYLLSATHLRDFAMEQLLAGPLTLVFLMPALVGWVRARGHRDLAFTFLVVTALTCLAATFAADEPMLGYARDWDLFVPALLPVLVATAVLWTHALVGRDGGPGVLRFLLVVSALSLAPWILVNRSEGQSLQRMGELPLGLGRSAVVVGNWHLRQGDPVAAQGWFEKALREHENNNNALNLLGNIHYQQGEIETALEYYERAIALRPRKIEYRDKIALVLTSLKRYAQSYPHFEVLVRERPAVGSYWLRYAQALRQGNRPAESEQTYRRAVEALTVAVQRSPQSFPIHMDLGTAFASLGERERAQSHLQRAVDLDPNSTAALYQLSGVLVEMGRHDEARPHLRRLLEVQPDHPQRRAIEQWLTAGP